MAEGPKKLTGGVLLLRNKYYIVIYRGKDFLPPSVAAALAERQELAKRIQDVEEKVRCGVVDAAQSGEDERLVLPTSLATASAKQSQDVERECGVVDVAQAGEKMIEEASKAKSARLVKQIEHKLVVAQAKKLRAVRLLAKIEASMIPAGPDHDQEPITDELNVGSLEVPDVTLLRFVRLIKSSGLKADIPVDCDRAFG